MVVGLLKANAGVTPAPEVCIAPNVIGGLLVAPPVENVNRGSLVENLNVGLRKAKPEVAPTDLAAPNLKGVTVVVLEAVVK